MSPDSSITLENVFSVIKENAKGNIGIICLNAIIELSLKEELEEFLKYQGIQIPSDSNLTNLEIFKYICRHFHNNYLADDKNQALYSDSLNYIGDTILRDKNLYNNLVMNDFLSKKEVINVFSDFCADLGISVYSTSQIEDYSLDLYLTKKTPFLKTEAVFVRMGKELDEAEYAETLRLMEKSSEIAYWTVLVITPLGAAKVGLHKLIGDLDKLGVWLYIIDPILQRVLGVFKGSKSKTYDSDIRDNFIQKLPREPIRAPSQIIKFSKYNLEDSESYKTKDFRKYEILTQDKHKKLIEFLNETPEYRNIFNSIIIMHQSTGTPMVSYSKSLNKNNEILISGFLTAMDDFVQRIGGARSMKEINYKNFFVQAAYGEKIKLALFLSEPADEILKERLSYFVNYFEKNYESDINKFRTTGDTALFEDKEIVPIIKHVLKI
ncbi:MAG: hypothetical protein GF383_04220 [Candidatus Lokiarchaeota archaeon]|nr:hypothetical protein [Candidatus Lokiarchaeota archaeon]MBD3338960.1 hypothetical protein [Candidatus Lokiarchaeota archaeon]